MMTTEATVEGRMQGYGCMGMSAFYTSARTVSEQQKIDVFHEAVKSGVKLFNSATFYGPLNEDGYGENLRLIRKCLQGINRSDIQLMVKVGMDTRFLLISYESESDVSFIFFQMPC
jgi:aryl-alcohol dehydrogenase-like predicted oxidoreductase